MHISVNLLKLFNIFIFAKKENNYIVTCQHSKSSKLMCFKEYNNFLKFCSVSFPKKMYNIWNPQTSFYHIDRLFSLERALRFFFFSFLSNKC